MDEDDGLLLNFAPPVQRAAAARGPRPSASGGGNNNSHNKSQSFAKPAGQSGGAGKRPANDHGSNGGSNLSTGANQRPVKKLRLEPASAGGGERGNAARQERTSSQQPRNGPSGGQRSSQTDGAASTGGSKPSAPGATTIVSSLFTGVSIPRISAKPLKLANKFAVGPSNAPLSGPVTFETLGLHPLLVQHISSKGKMAIGERPTDIQQKALRQMLGMGTYEMVDEGEDEDEGQRQSSALKRRDVLLASQTGSGKTLAFLLPILHSLLPLSSLSFIHRSITGTLAIILTPTRELARQIHEVLEKLVNLPLRRPKPEGEKGSAEEEEEEEVRMSRWIVPTLLCGGSTKNHEKLRLRKGSTIVVATPGRLLDHLQNTASFDVGKLRWLVLDEADRLMELGFKETLEGIVRAIDGRRRISMEAARESAKEKEGNHVSDKPAVIGRHNDEDHLEYMGVKWWQGGRRTVLCSATIDENVQILAGSTLKDPLVIRGHGGRKEAESEPAAGTDAHTSAVVATDPSASLATEQQSVVPDSEAVRADSKFVAPSQLRQHYLLVPPKLRIVTLVALLRQSLFSAKFAPRLTTATAGGVDRIIVFMSCTDSVDFHWNGIGWMRMGANGTADAADESVVDASEKKGQIAMTNDVLPGCSFFRLHGSMSQAERIASLKAFSSFGTKKEGTETEAIEPEPAADRAAILFCTSVASRGLDLPSVRTVIQLDAPNEGGVEEYVHRVGRTARVGKSGQSWLMLLPHEKEIMQRYRSGMTLDDGSQPVLCEVDFRDVLLHGYGGTADEYENRATDVQVAWERWVLRSAEAAQLARKAYLSHLRAYATHPTAEKAIFSLRNIHLGHLAKAFALREAPGQVKSKARSEGKLQQQQEQQKSTAAAKAAKLATAAAAAGGVSAETAKLLAIARKFGDDATLNMDESDPDAEDRRNKKSKKAKAAPSSSAPALIEPRQSLVFERNQTTEDKMYAAVRLLGKRTKKSGQLAAHDADEFQIG